MIVKRFVVPLFVTAAVGSAVAVEIGQVAPAGAAEAVVAADTSVAQAAAAGSTTAKATAAANAFLASLSASQRAKAQFAFAAAAKTTGWSNLPTRLVPRNGVAVSDLSAAQTAKLKTLLQTILSSQGYADEEAVRKADTYLTQQQASGNGGAQDLEYGEGLYSIAFFGTPSTSKKWTVQFGGHHLAIHLTFSGATLSNTPYFFGAEPNGSFTVSGKAYAPVADEAAALFGAVQALTTAQKATAKLSQSFDDVLVGPQKDGQFPTAEGVTVSSLSAAQQALVTKAIRTYVGDMPTAEANAIVAAYRKQYAQTKLAWATSTDPGTEGAYVRIQGPRVWIEIVVQGGIVLSGVHYHSIERDAKTDYGAGT